MNSTSVFMCKINLVFVGYWAEEGPAQRESAAVRRPIS